MKKAISMLIAILIMGAVCAGAFMLTGRFTTAEAVWTGLSAAVAGAFAPILAAWVQKLVRSSRGHQN